MRWFVSETEKSLENRDENIGCQPEGAADQKLHSSPRNSSVEPRHYGKRKRASPPPDQDTTDCEQHMFDQICHVRRSCDRPSRFTAEVACIDARMQRRSMR